MVTLFSTPKAFSGHFKVIQRNAIQSWLRLRPSCQIILLGNDLGTSDICSEFGLRHVSDVARNELGTPLVNALFRQAERFAEYPCLCYINADIILMEDFLKAIERVTARFSQFLLVGRRWDVDIRDELDFSNGWERNLRGLLSEKGTLHAHTGIDYFVFPRGFWTEIPPFAIGRGAWDNWLVYKAKSQGTPIVDLTPMATIVHQNHDYGHLGRGKTAAFNSPEAARNLEMAGGYTHLLTVADASFRLTGKGVRRSLTLYYFYRRLVSLSTSHRTARWLLKAVRFVLGVMRGEKDTFALE